MTLSMSCTSMLLDFRDRNYMRGKNVNVDRVAFGKHLTNQNTNYRT